MKQFVKTYIRKIWVIALLAGIALIAAGAFAFSRPNAVTDDFFTVKSVTVTAGVSVTGKVKSAQAVDLAFDKSGRIASVPVDVGDRVKPDDVLVVLDNADVRAELSEAQATVRFQQAKLNALVKGTRPEELNITKTKVSSAGDDLYQAQLGLLSSLQSAYSSTEDAIHNKTDEFFISPRSENPQAMFPYTVISLTSIESGRVEVEHRLELMQQLLSNATTSQNLPDLSMQIKQHIAEAKLFLDNTALVLNAAEPTGQVTAATLTVWKNDLAAARIEVNSAITAILAADDRLKTSESGVNAAAGQLDLEQAGTVPDDVAAQQAQVDVALASAANIAAQLQKTYIRSPISGIVTKQDAKPGEIAFANTPLASVISDSEFEIEANIAEADIAKLDVGQKADVTLDAYGSDVVFHAVVVAIDPAETVVDGVPTYRTTFQFSETDARIKSGMTANIDISGESHTGVLAIPQRAVISRDGGKFVRIKNPKTKNIEEVPVKTSLRGSDGMVEVVSGLHEGDTVAISRTGS